MHYISALDYLLYPIGYPIARASQLHIRLDIFLSITYHR